MINFLGASKVIRGTVLVCSNGNIKVLGQNVIITKLALLSGRDRTRHRKTAQASISGPDSTIENSGNFDISTSISRISATENAEHPTLRQKQNIM